MSAENKKNQEIALHLENVTMQFGGVVSVNNLTLDVPKGQIIALIGPNGAGKTTAWPARPDPHTRSDHTAGDRAYFPEYPSLEEHDSI